MNADRNLRGSNSYLMVEIIPHLMVGLVVDTVLKQNMAFWASQWRLKVQLIGSLSISRLRAGLSLSWEGSADRTSLLLLKNLVRWKPPSFSMAIKLKARMHMVAWPVVYDKLFLQLCCHTCPHYHQQFVLTRRKWHQWCRPASGTPGVYYWDFHSTTRNEGCCSL